MLASFSDSNHNKALFVTRLKLLCDGTGFNFHSGHFACRVLLDFDLLRVGGMCGIALSVVVHELEANNWTHRAIGGKGSIRDIELKNKEAVRAYAVDLSLAESHVMLVADWSVHGFRFRLHEHCFFATF